MSSEDQRLPDANPETDDLPASRSAAKATNVALNAAAQAGELLRQLRQSSGIDPILLAGTLKVAPQKIQSLEEDRLDDLPDLTFARGLATTICRICRADPGPVLALMPVAVPRLQTRDDKPHETSFMPSTFYNKAGSRDDLQPESRIVGLPIGWLLVIVLVIGTLVVWFLPGRHLLRLGAAPHAASARNDVPSGSDTLASDPDGVIPTSHAAPPVSLATPAAQSSSSRHAAPVPKAPRGNGAVERSVVAFDATSRTWVSIRDGDGHQILSRTLAAGDKLNAGGKLPLSVTVGNKDAVTITVRGQPLDLQQSARGGSKVARFTVDPASSPSGVDD